MTILALVAAQIRWPALGARIGWTRDLSCGLYLLHFPLQAAFVLATMLLGIPRDAYESAWMFMAYFGVLTIIAAASLSCFERPLQAFLRE